MSSTTTNYNLHKIDLQDSPPDITVLNQNFDIIDSKMKSIESGIDDITVENIGAVAKTGDTMTGQLQVPKILFDRSNGVYGDGGIYKANQSGNASTQIMDRGSNNKYGILALNGQTQSLSLTFGQQNADGTSTTTSVNRIYHEGDKPNANDIGAVAKTGDTMSGNLEFKKAENGSSSIFKNHSSSADYGLVLKDSDVDGDYVTLNLSASNDSLAFRKTNGSIVYPILSDGSVPTTVQTLWTNNKYGRIYTGNNQFQIESYKTAGDSNDRTILGISNTAALDGNVLFFRRYTADGNKIYKIYGEHNLVPVLYPITTLTYGTPVTSTTCWYQVWGKLVVLSFLIAKGVSLSADTDKTIFTLPSGFRPAQQISVPTYTKADYDIRAEINTSGKVNLHCYNAITTDGILGFQASFFIE